MVYKSFRINCVTRIVLMTANIYLFFYFLLHTDLPATTGLIGILPVIQAVLLLKYVDRTNWYLSRALDAIQYDDFSERISYGSAHGSFKTLAAALNRVMAKFQENRLEKAQQFQYLQAIINQAGIGLISMTPDGRIDVINPAARRLLGISPLKNIRQLDALDREFTKTLAGLKNGEKAGISFSHAGERVQLSVQVREISLHQRSYRLLTLQNIQRELEEKESEAWKDLIRVLNHEIMNSITPVSSLAATANTLISGRHEIAEGDVEDIRQAIQAIERRSRGLMAFVRNYRELAKIPAPTLQVVSVASLFGRIHRLMGGYLGEKGISFRTAIEPENLRLRVDPNLVEQVLLNLLRNAVEAVVETERPAIGLTAAMDDRSGVIVQVSDNGPGIDPDVVSKIFIPFFTTRPEGSGIGLSLSRQIMRRHGGTIRVQSIPNHETIFSLRF